MNSRLKILKISYLAALLVLLGTTLKAQMTVNVAVTNPSCFAYTNGQATANVTGGTSPYSYSWSNGQGGGQTVLGIRAGNYTVTVTDAAGVRTTKNFTAGEPTQLVGTASPVGGVCLAGLMTYQGNGSGGIAPYSYVWRSLGTNVTTNGPMLNAPTAGSYHLSVTDAQNCQVTKVVNIMGDIDVTIRTVAVSCGGNGDGVAEARVSGGMPPYAYRWNSSSATTATLTGLSGGTYIVTVTDANGCQKAAVATVQEAAVLNPNLIVTGICTGDGSAKVVPTGGTAPFTITWSNGGIGNRQSNLGVGQYYVTVTDAAGCNKAQEFKISKQSGVTITPFKYDATCLGQNTGFAKVTVPGDGLGTYTFKWNNGTTTSSPPTASEIGNLAPGTYTVTATDGAGCSDVATFNINAQRTVQFSANPTDAACGSTTGAITITNPNGGTAPYTYKWSNGATTPSVSGLAVGLYMVTVTDATGCYGVQTVNIQGTSNITFTTTKTNAQCNTSTGSIAITNVAGGAAPFTYSWSDLTGVNQPSSRLNLAAGTYTLTIRDAAGCSKTTTIVVANQASFNLTGNKTDATCGNADGSATVAATIGGTAPFTYLWSNGARTQTISNVAAGNYTVTVTDATGCAGTTTVTVFGIGNFTIGTTATNSACAGATGTASVTNVTGGTAPYTYRWSNGATTQTITNLPPGNYIAIVTDATGCQAASRTMVVGSTSTVTAGVPALISATCSKPNGKITVTGANGVAPYTYKVGTKTNSTGVFDSLPAGKYVILITDAAGCTFTTDSLKVDDKGAVKAQFAIQQLSCIGDSVTVRFPNNTINGITYSWLFSDNRTSTVVSPTANFSGPEGYVRLIARSPEGCIDTLIQGFPAAALKFTLADTVATCANSTVPATVINTGNQTIRLIYKWTPPTFVVGNDSAATATLRVPTVGTNKVYVLVKNDLGCSRLDSIFVKTVDKAFNPSDITFKQDCQTRAITFTNAGALGPYYTWVYGNPRNPIATKDSSNVFTYVFPKDGRDSLILIPKLACLDTIKVPFTVRSGPAVTITASNDSAVCNADRLTLRATSNTGTYEWSQTPNFATIIGTGATLLATPSNRSNVYYVRSKNADGCTAVDTVTIINAEIKISHITPIDLCLNVDKTITIVNTSGDPLKVKWTAAPSGMLVGSDTLLNPTVKISTDGTLIGVFTNNFGCVLRDTIPLKVRSVKAAATASARTLYPDDVVTLFSTPTGTGFKYSWMPTTTINTPTTASTTAIVKETTRYVVKVTDQYGCEDTVGVTVNIITPSCAEPFVFIPKAFTPNGDNINEKVYVRGEYLVTMELSIYNRWGEQVYYTQNRADGWDGTFKGAAVCPDVYGYYLRGKCKKGEDFFIKGNITVLK
jgi:gliding motility-associated-like protein